MQETKGRAVCTLLILALLLTSPTFLGVNFAQQTTMFVDPSNQIVYVCTRFTVDIKVQEVESLYAFEFFLSYDTQLMDTVDVELGPFLNPPNHIVVNITDEPNGLVIFGAQSDPPAIPASGSGTLATITFHCTGLGITQLHLYNTQLWDPAQNPIGHATADGFVTQTELPWYVKPSHTDYAPSGMPDFDQKQDGWVHPSVGWSWCGPVAAANSLWWLDSEYESLLNPLPVPPPAISDSFKLLQAYGPWDDHDPQNLEPFVNQLGFLMDTDGLRTNNPLTAHSGTFFKDMEVGISQYLQKKGVNPGGDCDGDGDTDFDDAMVIAKAMGSTPGSPRWNMAADLNQDNIVDIYDALRIGPNYGKIGMFYEHTLEFPAFPWIEEEVEACQDVELLLEFWQDMGGGLWERWNYDPGGQGGHYVTVAGGNSNTSQLLISDPWWDAFEAGAAPGESPIPHPAGHLPDVHNDTKFVSHDAYFAAPWMLPQPSPYPGQPIWELAGYLQALGWNPQWHAFIRAAIVTSPENVVVTDVRSYKQPCSPMPTIGQNLTTRISATVKNMDSTAQTFQVTVYSNWTAIGSTTVTNLLPNASATVTVATWNTTGWNRGDYYLSASTDVGYQNFTSSTAIRVLLNGDINADKIVDILDAILISNSFMVNRGEPLWNNNADLNDDDTIDILDGIILSNHFLESEP